MPQVKTLLSTFSAGELDPNLASRSDVTAYFQGCTQLKKFFFTSTRWSNEATWQFTY